MTGAPRPKIDKESIDLGDRKVGQPVSASFEITNVGDQLLRFTEAPYVEVVAGCRPPTPTIGAMVLQPGQKTIVSMLFKMPDITMGGLNDFRIHLHTNDPGAPDKTLQVLSNWASDCQAGLLFTRSPVLY